MLTTVSREGDKLISRRKGREVELLSETDTTFFVRGDPEGTRVIFVKDASGRVTHEIQRPFGWTDRIVKKIK